jgi:ribonuclease P protein component
MAQPARNLRLDFPAARRLKLNREFARVREAGRSIRGKFFLLGVLELPETETPFRAGFVTSKRVGGAVVRNRVRRRLREIVRRHQHEIRPALWLVLVAHTVAAKASSAALEDEWLRLAERASILRA